jgi:iduronate 2-sulfatase
MRRSIGVVMIMLAMVEGAPSCTEVSGQCYHNSNHILATLADPGSAGACCTVCSTTAKCHAYTYWIPKGSAAHSCRLYSTNSTLVGCGATDASGWQASPTAPTPAPPTPTPAPAPAGALNVLFIAIDDLRPQLGVYGTAAITPHLDGFAKSALLFDNAHAQVAHCSPSRNSLMSGRVPNTIKVWNMDTNFRDAKYAPADITALPQHFKDHGYFTTGIGKTYHPGQPPSFDQALSWSEPYSPAAGGACRAFKGGHPSNYACTSDGALADDQVADVAIAKLEQLANGTLGAYRGQPFLVAAGIHKPHLPYFWKPQDEAHYPPAAQTAIPPPAALATPVGMPPVAWMACMGEQGEEPNFVDFNSINITQSAPVPEALVRNVTRGYMASATYVDRQVR